MTAAVLALFLAPPIDPAELLPRVAARYAALDHFLLEVRETSFHESPIPIRIVSRKRLAVAPHDRFLLEVRSSRSFTIVSDGQTVRGGQSDSKNYFEQDLGDSAHRQVDEQLDTLVRRYASLDRLVPSARFLRLDKVKTPSGALECAVVEISVPASAAPRWRETLWIDPRRAVVLRSDLQPSGVSFDHVYREFLLPPGDELPGPALFVFTPRKGARPQRSQSSPSRRPSAESGIPPA